jgi:hypothetical protein
MKSGILLMLVSLSNLAQAAQEDVFANKAIGLEITKPATWYYVSAPQYLDNIASTKFDDHDVQAWVAKYITSPLVAMATSTDPSRGFNANFKVQVKPSGSLKGQPATAIVAAVLPLAQKAFKDYQVDQPPIEVEISGIKSAYARINFTAQMSDGRSDPATSEVWVIPRGDYFFILGAVSARNADASTREEVAAIVRSVKIRH